MKSKELIRLQREWYKRLADEGFNDIENFDKNMEPEDILKRDSNAFVNRVQDKMPTTTLHYRHAGYVLHSKIMDKLYSAQHQEYHH